MTATLQRQTVNTGGQYQPTPYGSLPPRDFPRTSQWVKVALGVLALVVSAAIGAVTAALVVAGSVTTGTPTPSAPPSASAVHAANIKLCTLYYSAGEAMANWDRQHPSPAQQDGTAGASVYIVTGQFLMWALSQAPDANQDLRQNIQAVAQASIDAAGVYSGKPEGMIQPPTFVPNSAFGDHGQKIHDFCVKDS